MWIKVIGKRVEQDSNNNTSLNTRIKKVDELNFFSEKVSCAMYASSVTINNWILFSLTILTGSDHLENTHTLNLQCKY